VVPSESSGPLANDPSQVYLAPNIRNQALDTLYQRLETRRSRRLIFAIEVNQKKQQKLVQEQAKDAEKFSKKVDAAAKKLDAARDAMDKAEQDLREATALHNNMALRANAFE
jgi:hypothetical protein